MLLVLAVLFALSWMPYHAVSLYADFASNSETANSLTSLSFALLLGHSHSAQNPIVYCLMNNNFRNGMIGLLCCRGYGWGIESTLSPVSCTSMHSKHLRSLHVVVFFRLAADG
jgi:hypothetical protein